MKRVFTLAFSLMGAILSLIGAFIAAYFAQSAEPTAPLAFVAFLVCLVAAILCLSKTLMQYKIGAHFQTYHNGYAG